MSWFTRRNLFKYNDDQPRDEDGKWTSGGGGTPGYLPTSAKDVTATHPVELEGGARVFSLPARDIDGLKTKLRVAGFRQTRQEANGAYQFTHPNGTVVSGTAFSGDDESLTVLVDPNHQGAM